MVSKTLFSAIT